MYHTTRQGSLPNGDRSSHTAPGKIFPHGTALPGSICMLLVHRVPPSCHMAASDPGSWALCSQSGSCINFALAACSCLYCRPSRHPTTFKPPVTCVYSCLVYVHRFRLETNRYIVYSTAVSIIFAFLCPESSRGPLRHRIWPFSLGKNIEGI